MDKDRFENITPTAVHLPVIEQVERLWKPLCEARIALDVAIREDAALQIFYCDDHLEHSTVELGLDYRRERLITHLNNVYYFDEIGSARYLHGGIGVSNYTLDKVIALNNAKRQFREALPGHAAKIGGISFNRYLAHVLEPDAPRLNYSALNRQLPVVTKRADPKHINPAVVNTLVSVSIGSFIHTKAPKISLDYAYKLVGGYSKAIDEDSVALLNPLPSKTGNKKLDVVHLKHKKGLVKSQAKLSYYIPSTNSRKQVPLKLALPLFYSVEDLPQLSVKVAQTNAPRKKEHRTLTRDRLAFSNDDYEIYRCLPGDLD